MLLFLTSNVAAQSPIEYGSIVGWQSTQGTWTTADLTGDGFDDFIIPGTGQLAVDVSEGNGVIQPPWLWIFSPKCNGGRCANEVFSDVNGDGRKDLVGFMRGVRGEPGFADVWVWLSKPRPEAPETGGAFEPGTRWTDNFCDQSQDCTVADVDGDGKGDLVAFTPEFGLVWVSRSTGVDFEAPVVWNNYFCILGEKCTVGDVDGDRKADLILFKPRAKGAERGNVLVSRSTGTSFAAPTLAHGQFCVDDQPCFVEDINGDRRIDLVSAQRYLRNDGTLDHTDVLMSLSNGNTFDNIPFQTILENGKLHGLANLYGDARAELLWEGAGDHTNQVLLFTAKTPGQGGEPPQTGSGPRPASVSAVDVFNCNEHTYPDSTENRRVDVVWVSSSTGYVRAADAVDAQFNAAGSCPFEEDGTLSSPAVTVSFQGAKEGETVQVFILDPELPGCSHPSDPTISSCRFRSTEPFIYSAHGSKVIFEAGPLD